MIKNGMHHPLDLEVKMVKKSIHHCGKVLQLGPGKALGLIRRLRRHIHSSTTCTWIVDGAHFKSWFPFSSSLASSPPPLQTWGELQECTSMLSSQDNVLPPTATGRARLRKTNFPKTPFPICPKIRPWRVRFPEMILRLL